MLEVKDAADKYLVKSDTVTVYSSVVYNCKDENKKQEACSEKGIHIKVEDGVFKANEQNVVLKLSDIYTLDRELGETSARHHCEADAGYGLHHPVAEAEQCECVQR